MPFALSSGVWTSYGFQARFRADAVTRSQVRRFRDWLLSESEETSAWLSRKVKKH